MKIKCPLKHCVYEYESDIDTASLINHLETHDKIFIRIILGELIFKIHEKIEMYSKFDTLCDEAHIQVLKSLLENEK